MLLLWTKNPYGTRTLPFAFFVAKKFFKKSGTSALSNIKSRVTMFVGKALIALRRKIEGKNNK